jgi:hypothetical protein
MGVKSQRAFSGKVCSGFPQKMRPRETTTRYHR